MPPTMPFGDLLIDHDPRILTPREWTTAQSRWAVELLASAPNGRLLELCTGAGHIGLLAAAASARPAVLVDIDPVACSFAQRNARQVATPVEVRCGPMSEVVGSDELFPVVVADPPWVPRDDIGRFPEDPRLAIDGGDDGLHLARECLRVIDTCLHPSGIAVLQLGNTEQAAAITDWLPSAGLDLRTAEVRSHAPRGVLLSLHRTSP